MKYKSPASGEAGQHDTRAKKNKIEEVTLSDLSFLLGKLRGKKFN